MQNSKTHNDIEIKTTWGNCCIYPPRYLNLKSQNLFKMMNYTIQLRGQSNHSIYHYEGAVSADDLKALSNSKFNDVKVNDGPWMPFSAMTVIKGRPLFFQKVPVRVNGKREHRTICTLANGATLKAVSSRTLPAFLKQIKEGRYDQQINDKLYGKLPLF